MFLLNANEDSFGLDISNGSLRLAQMQKKGKKIFLRAYNEIKLPKNCIVDGQIEDQKSFLLNFNKLIKTRMGHTRLSKQVVCSLPEAKTFLKHVTIEAYEDCEIEEKIKEAIAQHLPLGIEEIYYDSQIVKINENKLDVLIGASPKKIVDSYMTVLEDSGFIPIILEVEAASISRIVIELNGDVQPHIVIDIGATWTGLFLYDENTIKFTISLPISGDEITSDIGKTIDLNTEQAEKAKIVCGLDRSKCDGAIFEIYNDKINELCERIKKAIDFYNSSFNNAKKIQKITLCGGGANFLNISETLKSQLDIEVAISNPFAKILNPNPKYFTRQVSQSYLVALGLGLRGVMENSIKKQK